MFSSVKQNSFCVLCDVILYSCQVKQKQQMVKALLFTYLLSVLLLRNVIRNDINITLFTVYVEGTRDVILRQVTMLRLLLVNVLFLVLASVYGQ